MKYDLEEFASAVDKSNHSSTVGVDTALDGAVDRFDQSSVHSKPTNSQNQGSLRDNKKSIEVIEEKKERLDAERRLAGHPVLEGGGSPLPNPTPKPKDLASLERKKKLSTRLETKICEGGNEFDRGLNADEHAAFAATGYFPNDMDVLSEGFVHTVWEIWDKHKSEKLRPGILCTKVIDRCVSQQEACKTLGADPSDYYWPPNFTDHRERLRERERLEEEKPERNYEREANL